MKWYQHEEHAAIAAAIAAWRDQGESDIGTKKLVERIEMALRSTDWRRVEAHAKETR